MNNGQHVTAFARIASPLGPLLLAASDQGLCGLWFEEQKHLPPWLPAQWVEGPPSHPVLRGATEQLDGYFAGQREAFDLQLDLRHGTEFQCAVWHAMAHIPVRASLSYGALAQRVGRPAAVRAVGAAVGRNPVGIIVPCHRVMGADGSLTGYAGGLWRKTALLRLELGQTVGQPVSTLAPPAAHAPPGVTQELF